MPTAQEFEAAAQSLDELAGDAGQAGAEVIATAEQSGLEGDSALETRIRAELEAAQKWLSSVSNSIGPAIDELGRRAAVCADYASAMDQWRAAVIQFELVDDGTGVAPPKPQKPYPWVEE